MRVPFTIVDAVRAYADGLAAHLREGTDPEFVREEPQDLMHWAEQGAPRLVVVAERDGPVPELAELGRIADGGELTVVVLLPDDSSTAHRHALKRGATVGVTWTKPPDHIRHVCVDALNGLCLQPAPQAQALASARLACEEDIPLELADRQISWLRRLQRGDTAKRIAEDDSYSERHFRRLLLELYAQLGARNRSEAIAKAAGYGLLDFG